MKKKSKIKIKKLSEELIELDEQTETKMSDDIQRQITQLKLLSGYQNATEIILYNVVKRLEFIRDELIKKNE